MVVNSTNIILAGMIGEIFVFSLINIVQNKRRNKFLKQNACENAMGLPKQQVQMPQRPIYQANAFAVPQQARPLETIQQTPQIQEVFEQPQPRPQKPKKPSKKELKAKQDELKAKLEEVRQLRETMAQEGLVL